MLIAVLFVCNLPVFFLLGWLVFDTKDDAADTFYETIVALLKRMLVPKLIRVLMGDDDDDASGILPIAGFLIACALLVYGEYYLLTKYLLAS